MVPAVGLAGRAEDSLKGFEISRQGTLIVLLGELALLGELGFPVGQDGWLHGLPSGQLDAASPPA